MKRKITALLCLFFVGIMTSFGQTYFYKCVYDIDEKTGARSSPSFRDIYITFNDQGCYFSDKDGNMVINTFYKYRGRKNNLHVYQAYEEVKQITMYGFVNTGEINWLDDKITFSADRKRGNWKLMFYKYIRIFERADPNDIEIPDTFY